MKKFDIRGVKGVFANLRGSEKPSIKTDLEIVETLQTYDFQCGKLIRHGFPFQPTCLAWDPLQKLLAVGTKTGAVRLLGRPGVDICFQHDGDVIVLQVAFLINEGALITACSDDSVHLWNFRQKMPEVVHSLKFSRERITCLHLPFQSKWLYVGTERGNVHIVNIESFTLSAYTINWNKAIELARKTHPGPVVHLSDNPLDSNRLLIGFEMGLMVLWDLRCKMAEFRFHCADSLRDACWNNDGKQFMCSHADGSISTWQYRQQSKPASVISPHAKSNANGSACKPINRIEWKAAKNGESEPYVIFSGGMSYDAANKVPCLTVMRGKSMTVLEMEHQIVDFRVLCNNIWPYECADPYAIAVLLSNDLLFIDLVTDGYPCFQCPYAMDVHESPVTCLKYYSDCPSDLIPAFYSCGAKQKRKGFSTKEFPVQGGVWGSFSCSYFEMIVSGHVDGSLKFWDSSGINLQFLYKVKTAKLFERSSKCREDDIQDVLAVQRLYLDEESRMIAVAGSHHVIIFTFSKKETQKELPVVMLTSLSEVVEASESPVESDTVASLQRGYSSAAILPPNPESKTKLYRLKSAPTFSSQSLRAELRTAIKVRSGAKKYCAGYQPELVSLLQWRDGLVPPVITSLCLNSAYGLLAVSTTSSLCIVDIVQRSCILNVLPSDLCGSMTRSMQATVSAPLSPKLRHPSLDESHSKQEESQKSSSEQSIDPNISDSKNDGSVVGPGGAHLDRKLSLSTPNVPLDVAQHETDTDDGATNTHTQLSKTTSDTYYQADINGHGDDSGKQKSLLNRMARRLSVKVGLINNPRHKPNRQTLSAVPAAASSSGFFADQSKTAENPSRVSAKVNVKNSAERPATDRSRSPSISSLEASATDVIQFVMFTDGYTKKSDQDSTPGLWVGTGNGMVIAMNVNLPGSERASQPVVINPAGTTFHLKGTIMKIAFLDSNGHLVPVESTLWIDGRDAEKRDKRLVSRLSRSSPSSTDSAERSVTDKHIAVMGTDVEIRCIGLPSQNQMVSEKLPEGSSILKADVIIIKESVCYASLCSYGGLMVHSLPSLRLLYSINFFSQFDARIARTFDFGNHGHAVYMCSATELQKITLSSEMCRSMSDMQCEPFLAKENPEPPKASFLKNLFNSGPSPLDREELFGQAGKASLGIATHIPGTAMQHLQANATGLGADMARTRQALDERGEKLGHLDMRTEMMKERAREFSNNAAQLASKYRDSKWYQL